MPIKDLKERDYILLLDKYEPKFKRVRISRVIDGCAFYNSFDGNKIVLTSKDTWFLDNRKYDLSVKDYDFLVKTCIIVAVVILSWITGSLLAL